jgi:hypothetical protein
MSSADSIIDNIMPELPAYSCYKYFHVSTATPNGFMTAPQQFLHDIMSKLSGHTCYENLYLFTLPEDRLLIPLLSMSFLSTLISGSVVTCSSTSSRNISGIHR